MELWDGNYPETYDSKWGTFKKTCKKYWLQLVASLMCFGSTGFNIFNTIRHLNSSNVSSAVLCIIFALTTLMLAIANLALFWNNYQRIKLIK